jgi:hypothetical protein
VGAAAEPLLVIDMEALNKFIYYHKLQGDQQRLGQRFVNMFFRKPWPELFYMKDEGVALEMIRGWLNDNQHVEELPTPNQSYIDAILKR